VQETFAKALAASGPVPVGTNLNAWLRRIMINTSISGYRTSRAGPQFVTGDARQHEVMPAPGLVQDPRRTQRVCISLPADFTDVVRWLRLSLLGKRKAVDSGEERSSPVAFGWVSMGSSDALRSFDPLRIAELEYRMWVAYYLRRWRNLLVASVSLFWLESVTRLYCYLFGETAAVVRPAAAHRVRAMELSDQWVREGCRTDSPLLPLVRAYAALLAAVHHEER
jgi:hypothetical protein